MIVIERRAPSWLMGSGCRDRDADEAAVFGDGSFLEWKVAVARQEILRLILASESELMDLAIIHSSTHASSICVQASVLYSKYNSPRSFFHIL